MSHAEQNEIKEPEADVRAVCAVDWLEYRACGTWSGLNASEWIERLTQAKNTAAASRQDEPLEIAHHIVMVAGNGMGSGRQSYMDFRASWGPVWFAVAERDSAELKHANLYVKIPGEACVLYGEEKCRDVIDEILTELGFEVTQDSVARIDICLDVTGRALQDALLPACERGQMKGSLLRTGDRLAIHGQPRTGLSLGSRKSVRVNLYDKLHEATIKGGEYLEAMKVHRWDGQIPGKAFRLEYQLDKSWLRRWKLQQVNQVLRQLPDIVSKLTDYVAFPMWVITDTVPDRKNKNQSRSEPHPDWIWTVEQFRQHSGTCIQPLEPIAAGLITPKMAYQFIRGYATSAAASMRIPINSFEDCFSVIRELHERNDGTDEDWKQRWLQKARKNGALEEMMAFSFGNSKAVVTEEFQLPEEEHDRKIA